jgi:hypothetical protein
MTAHLVKVFLENHKEWKHAKNDRQRMGVYEVGNEGDQRKAHEAMADKVPEKVQSMDRDKWHLAVCSHH